MNTFGKEDKALSFERDRKIAIAADEYQVGKEIETSVAYILYSDDCNNNHRMRHRSSPDAIGPAQYRNSAYEVA